MKSLIIGIARVGSANDHALNRDTKYISMYGSYPEIDFSIACGQDEFLNRVDELRYKDADPGASAAAIQFFEELTTKLMNDLKYVQIDPKDTEPLHLRLVTSPLELAQIPFEFALTPGAVEPRLPLLTNPHRMITFTRELRQETAINYSWPHIPRILFAWAAPLEEVPHAGQREALDASLEALVKPMAGNPFPIADTKDLLTELPNASLKMIRAELNAGIGAKKPYTHLNILAHGGQVQRPSGRQFRIVLCQDGTTDQADMVDGRRLIEHVRVGEENDRLTVVTLSACDSGNTGNTFAPSGSLVYQLHNAGIPCVIASQFPLTQEGSVTMVRKLYQNLVNGCDPRVALYETRVELKKDRHHDWASLVAYARFPENIDEQLQEAQLKSVFGTMGITNAWMDHVFKQWEHLPPDQRKPALELVSARLDHAIERLSAFGATNQAQRGLLNAQLKAEQLGLLASAYKRKAEYFFRLSSLPTEDADDLMKASREALETAKHHYQMGFEASTENHWTAMQYLSLKTVTEGSAVDDPDLWTVIKFLAERQAKQATNTVDSIWSWATLSELHLLKPFVSTGQVTDQTVAEALQKSTEYMSKIVAAAGDGYKSALESTARQLDRYINWWPGLFPGSFPSQLSQMATKTRAMLPPLDALLP